MWEQLKRIIKPNGAILLMAQQPFTSVLVNSNLKMFRYCWVWNKGYSTGFQNANKMPMKKTEDVCVFYKSLPRYIPQGLISIKPKKRIRKSCGSGATFGGPAPGLEGKEYETKFTNYPSNIIETKKEKTFHPTGKSVALLEYLIKTYTLEGETVLDFTMGSGSTGVAAVNLSRDFIGIELDKDYFEIAKQRIEQAQNEKK